MEQPSVHQRAAVQLDGETPGVDQTVIASSTEPIVGTESGKVRGYIRTGTYIFKGIPYATAERFMPPEQPQTWEGFRSTLTYGPISPQPFNEQVYRDEEAFTLAWPFAYQAEDCQRLNVWTRGIDDGGERPVMVWLHGGGFSSGSAHEQGIYDGENLSKKGDVVVVSVNHRLNILGFLDLSAFGYKYKYSANVGLMDIVAALNWVKNNIRNFGGDPENVTIFGQSGGGGKVSTLLATPAAKGLFHKAIIQSGSTIRVGEAENSRKVGVAILEQLGLKPDQVDELQKISYDDLYRAGQAALGKVREEMMKENPSGNIGFRFGWSPVVDGDYVPTHPFDPAAPVMSKDIPVMVGSTINEIFPTLLNPSLRNLSMEKAEETIQKNYGEKATAFIEEFGKVYPGYTPEDLIDTDIRFRSNVIRQARLKSAQNGALVYVYLLTWQNPLFDGVYKSLHCMEIPFVFDNATKYDITTGGGRKAQALADRVSRAWINFARKGNPNHEGLPDWPAFTEKNYYTMILDYECVLKNNHDRRLLGTVEGN
jgi:para-nitrobenzyl esterase